MGWCGVARGVDRCERKLPLSYPALPVPLPLSLQNPSDGWVVQAATQGDCCAACRSDVRCTAAVFAGGKCYAKVGGTSVPKPGSVACVPVPAE